MAHVCTQQIVLSILLMDNVMLGHRPLLVYPYPRVDQRLSSEALKANTDVVIMQFSG